MMRDKRLASGHYVKHRRFSQEVIRERFDVPTYPEFLNCRPPKYSPKMELIKTFRAVSIDISDCKTMFPAILLLEIINT